MSVEGSAAQLGTVLVTSTGFAFGLGKAQMWDAELWAFWTKASKDVCISFRNYEALQEVWKMLSIQNHSQTNSLNEWRLKFLYQK